jgi:hypothetical protein
MFLIVARFLPHFSQISITELNPFNGIIFTQKEEITNETTAK